MAGEHDTPNVSNAGREAMMRAHYPLEKYWGGVIKILQHLKGIRKLGLAYQNAGRRRSEAFVDGGYAEDKVDRRAVSRTVVMVGGALLFCSSKTRAFVTLSSAKAEDMLLADCMNDALFLRMLLKILGARLPDRRVTISEDKGWAINLASSQTHICTNRMRHIDVRHHCLREIVEGGKRELVHVRLQGQITDDVLTKYLRSKAYSKHRRALLNFMS